MRGQSGVAEVEVERVCVPDLSKELNSPPRLRIAKLEPQGERAGPANSQPKSHRKKGVEVH